MDNNKNRYEGMTHRFDPLSMLVRMLALKGVYYPGIWIEQLMPTTKLNSGTAFNPSDSTEVATKLNEGTSFSPAEDELKYIESVQGNVTQGTPLRHGDGRGGVYFMPVWIESSLGRMEMPAAAISIRGKKTIVSTPLVGRRGTVKELINVGDYEISIKGVIMGATPYLYPEQGVQDFRDLFELNEAVKLISALSSLTLGIDDMIVIKSIEYPEVGSVENAQMIIITAETDSSIELIIP